MDFLKKYFPDLTPDQLSKFEALPALYTEYNAAVNVVSRKDIDELPVRHVLHSLAVARVCSFDSGARVLDVGCGGGFPVIPLAIMFPDVRFVAVDSIGKKIRVVQQVAERLGLSNVEAVNARAESVNGRFDYVVSRAVARTAMLKQWTWAKIQRGQCGSLPNGMILLKGGDLSEELSEAKVAYSEYTVANWFDEPFFETKKVVFIPKK